MIEEEGQRNRLTFSELLPQIIYVAALRPLSALKDSRVDRYISRFKPDWMRELVLQDIRPYLPVMVAAFLINVLSLAGIVFSMQVYDRVIPAQSYPTLYVLSFGVLVAVLFGFCCVKRVRTLWTCSVNAPICAFPIGYSSRAEAAQQRYPPLHW
ncbi:type I secretion protein, ATP-binding protein [Salmonella enterica subsp. arizonae]|nr:type I secretion protein, ATP-binding protein [Salmonella enterica subsp. arizonae]